MGHTAFTVTQGQAPKGSRKGRRHSGPALVRAQPSPGSRIQSSRGGRERNAHGRRCPSSGPAARGGSRPETAGGPGGHDAWPAFRGTLCDVDQADVLNNSNKQ